MWDLIVSVPDHCLSFYFPVKYRDESLNLQQLSWPHKLQILSDILPLSHACA